MNGIKTTSRVSALPPAQAAASSPPQPRLASVSHYALDAIAGAIAGTPFQDTELLVRHKGRDETIFLHSGIVKRACPALFALMQSGPEIHLDAMEAGVDPAGRAGAAKRAPQGARAPGVVPTSRLAADDAGLDDDGATDEHLFDAEDDEDDLDSAPSYVEDDRRGALLRAAPEEDAPSFTRDATPSTMHDPVTRGNTLLSKFMGRRGSSDIPPSPSLGERAGSGGRLRRYNAAPVQTSASTPPTGSRAAGARIFDDGVAPRLPTSRPQPGGAAAPAILPSTPAARRAPGPASEVAPSGGSRSGRRIRVTGITPRSVQALVFYLYTSQVHFVSAPHQNAHTESSSLHEDALEQLGDGSKQNPALWPPAFSSKAAYCVGQQLNLSDLTMRAFEHLTLNMSSQTVLADLLSPFGDHYAEIQRAQLDFITMHWEEVKSRPDFRPTIENLVHGQYPNSSASLFQLFSKLSISPSY
ncbi:hypothetical protein MSPP1_000024 [Malassezia sp. CBS 17886]|nr:hypothetical protein MSPP1_000024 [Malassezia sp. CBS 17886]